VILQLFFQKIRIFKNNSALISAEKRFLNVLKCVDGRDVEAVEYFLPLLPHSWDFLLSDKVGRFRVRFHFQLILSKRFCF